MTAAETAARFRAMYEARLRNGPSPYFPARGCISEETMYLRDLVASKLGMFVPVPFKQLIAAMRDEWGSLNERRVYRVLSAMVALGKILRTDDGYLLPRRRRVPVTPAIHARLMNGDYVRAGGDARCVECGRTYRDHDALDTPNGGWWAVACDGRLLKL